MLHWSSEYKHFGSDMRESAIAIAPCSFNSETSGIVVNRCEKFSGLFKIYFLKYQTICFHISWACFVGGLLYHIADTIVCITFRIVMMLSYILSMVPKYAQIQLESVWHDLLSIHWTKQVTRYYWMLVWSEAFELMWKNIITRHQSKYVPSQWQTLLQCSNISH